MYNERRKMASLLDHLASDQVLTEAFRWLCATRAHYHHNDDVWHALSVAQQPVERCRELMSRLHKQGAAASRIGTYVQRWACWVRTGLGGLWVEWGCDSYVAMFDCKT